jgi:hypothetical protein
MKSFRAYVEFSFRLCRLAETFGLRLYGYFLHSVNALSNLTEPSFEMNR